MPAPDSSRRPPGSRRWERLGVAGLIVAVVAVGLTLAFTPDDEPAEPASRTAVQGLLDTWSRAVRSADRAALAALVDPQARPGLLDAEVRRAEALAALPLADFGYELGQDPGTDVTDDVGARLGADEARAHTVLLRYAVEGIDDEPTRKPVTLLLARRGEQWRLVDDRPLPGAETTTWRGPWDYGPLLVRAVDTGAGGRSLVVGHPEHSFLVSDIAGELEAAVEAVDAAWGTEWPRRALVLVTASHDEFTAQVGSRYNGAEIAAVAVSDAVDHERGETTGQRIVFSPAAGQRLDAAGLRAILRHELTHVAARTDTVDGSPLWILEGYADYVGYRNADGALGVIAPTLAAAVAERGAPTALPADADFAGDGARLAYESAWSIATFVAGEFGGDRLTALYRRLATGPVEAAELDAALGDVLGADAEQFVARWQTWLEAQVPARVG
ncbi:hypothetical protein AAI421_06210 [Rhodococcus aetherivorans]|uniref:hypothetical protein n=1 Tax=Rhodococcus aetherivorans TaxID=191292 RepID=UPI000622CAFF|nr:hypothetical protein [Rhodococcus aetherivorans]AKE90415.1 membrane protein [Rhodococcus aetherivorans]